MIFGLERFLPCFLTSFSYGKKKGRRNDSSSTKEIHNGLCRQHLQRRASKNARRLWKEDIYRNRKERIKSQTNANNNQQAKYKQTPLRLLKKIWDMKQGSRNAMARNQRSRSKRSTAKRVARSRNKYNLKSGRRLPRKQRRERRLYRTRKRPQTRKRKLYASERPELQVVKVRRLRRYKSGGNQRERRLKLPVWTPQADRERLIDENPMSFKKSVEKSERDLMDDPLNVHSLHRSYVKKIHGRPAETTKENSPGGSKKHRRNRSRSCKAASVKRRAQRTFEKRIKRRSRSKKRSVKIRPKSRSRRRVSHRELNYLVQNRLKDKMDERRRRRGCF